jgi:branched-chain amino acid transport system substrate-binding protein
MTTSIKTTLLAAAFAIAALTGPVSGQDIKIGLLFSQSGPLSSYGAPMKKAAEYATKMINESGGINGHKLGIVILDDESNGGTFINGLNRAVDIEGVMALVGPITSGMFKAGGPIVKQKGVVMISPTATAPDLTQDNPYAFRNNPSEDVNIPELLKLVTKTQPNVRTISIIYDKKEAADRVIGELYEKLVSPIGWKVLDVTTYLSGQLNFADLVTKSLSSKPDIMAVAAHGADAANVARELRRQGYNGIILGGTPTVSEDYTKIGGSAVEKTYVVVPYYFGSQTAANRAFTEGYAKSSGQKTPDPWEASTYEVMGIITMAMKAVKVTGDPAKLPSERNAVRDAMAATTNYEGLIGPIGFDSSRVAVKKTILLEVKDGTWRPL